MFDKFVDRIEIEHRCRFHLRVINTNEQMNIEMNDEFDCQVLRWFDHLLLH